MDRLGRPRSICIGPLEMPLGGNTEATERTGESIGPHDMRILTREAQGSLLVTKQGKEGEAMEGLGQMQ
jgi:hypothetical protein